MTESEKTENNEFNSINSDDDNKNEHILFNEEIKEETKVDEVTEMPELEKDDEIVEIKIGKNLHQNSIFSSQIENTETGNFM